MYIKEELELKTFEAWQGGADTLATIKEAGLCEQAEEALGELFPNGATRTEINDVLWFDSDWLLQSLGLAEEEEEEE